MNNTTVMLLLMLKKPNAAQYIIEYIGSQQLDDLNEVENLVNEINSVVSDDVIHISSMNKLHQSLHDNLVDGKQKIQGSIIDLFVRNTAMQFNQMDFQQLITLWEQFYMDDRVTKNEYLSDAHHDKLIKTLQANLIDLKILRQHIETLPYNIKKSYVKAYLYAQLNYPELVAEECKKFFDLNLKALVPKKINQAMMHAIKFNILMNLHDEALNQISEGLRLAQQFSDEISINQCLYYLYEIAFKNGYNKQSLLLLEYTVNHSQQLPSLHRLQNALAYGAFIRYARGEKSLLKKKNIDWRDITQQAIKTILYSHNSYVDSLNSFNLITQMHYGNRFTLELALSDSSPSVLKCEALYHQLLNQPLECLHQFPKQLNKNMQIFLVFASITLFEQSDEICSIQWMKQWANELLKTNPDPFFQQLIGIDKPKHPKVLVNILKGLEKLKLIKEYSLKEDYIIYKLDAIEQILSEDINLAKKKLEQFEINQWNCLTKARYWYLSGRANNSIDNFRQAIEFAVQIGNLKIILDSYYHIAILADEAENDQIRDYASEQYIYCEELLFNCRENNLIRCYQLRETVINYHIGFLQNLNQLMCKQF